MRLLALLLALSSPALAQAPLNGIPGHVRVELQSASGWVELSSLQYDLQQSTRSFSVPAALAPQGPLRLRLSAPDNDETQIDWLALEGGKLLSAQTAKGRSELAKLTALDRDVAEIHGAPLLLSLQAPAGQGELRFQLAARSSNNASILNNPFRLGAGHVVGAVGGASGPLRLAAKEGASIRIDTGRMRSGSGHPEAPILAELTVKNGRLQGRLDFGLDNDPGADDYAAIVAYGANGAAKEFKVTPKDSRYGKARWDYGQAASWQHMRFDLDVPLAKLPRTAEGDLALELLAYGTCGSARPENDFYASSVSATAISLPGNLTITVGIAFNLGTTTPFIDVPVTITAWVVDPLGVTVSTQTINALQNNGSCTIAPSPIFYYEPTCSGTYTLEGFVIGGPGDPVPNSPSAFGSVVVSGGSVCAAPTATPVAQPSVEGVNVAMNSPRQGEAMVFGFDKPMGPARARVYNTQGELVADLSGNGALSWQTGKAAAGVYFIRVTGTYVDGASIDTWKKAAILP